SGRLRSACARAWVWLTPLPEGARESCGITRGGVASGKDGRGTDRLISGGGLFGRARRRAGNLPAGGQAGRIEVLVDTSDQLAQQDDFVRVESRFGPAANQAGTAHDLLP